MKKFVAAIIITAVIFQSCDPVATFDQPQPSQVKSLESFPQRLQGSYLAADEASVITISGNQITRHYDFDYKIHRDSIGKSYKITDSTLIDPADGTVEKIRLQGDTVIQHADWTDTLFSLSANNIIKDFKGYCILNSRYSDSAWQVNKLALTKGVLTVGKISAKEDIKKLKEITATTADTISTHFSLTKRQFKSFIKQQGFTDEETFNRMTAESR